MTGRPWDVAVIGGGPAGSSAAVVLARQGLRVLLIEASTYPHEKVCGEFLSPEGVWILDDLLSEKYRIDARRVAIHRFRITAPNGATWDGRLPIPAFSLSRGVLDQELAEAAEQNGAHVLERTRVVSVDGDLASGFQLRLASRRGSETVPARAVIGAYGRRSRLDQEFHRPFMRQDQPFMAFKAHFAGPSLRDRIELHAFPGGYCGLSDIEGGRQNVCMLVHRAAFEAGKVGREPSVDNLVTWMSRQNEALGDWLLQARRLQSRWMAIAQIPFVRKEPLVNDVLMAGDSAGVIVPLAGDGIAMALESGMLAANLVSKTLNGKGSIRDLRQAYPNAWRRKFQRRLRFGRLLQPLLLRPGAANAVIPLIAAVPAVGQFMIRNTRGKLPETLFEFASHTTEVQEE